MNIDFSILNSIIDSIAIIDKKGDITFTNFAWNNFAIENNAIIERTICSVNYLEVCEKSGKESTDATIVASGILKVIKKEIPVFEFEYPCHSPEKKRWFILRAAPVTINPELTIINHINITNRKLQEEIIENKNNQNFTINERLKSTLNKVVHDIQGPLKSISSLIDITKEENDSKTVMEHFNLINESVANLSTYIEETLIYSINPFNTESINFNELLNHYIESIKSNLKLNNIKLIFDVKQSDSFYSNKTEIYSILSNIIGNSIKYYDINKEEKFIKIDIYSDKKKAILKIEDNGIGIKENNLKNIYERGYQINKTQSKGAGLGLFMVKKSIESISGKVIINSQWQKGTEFIITLPNLA